MPEDEIAEPVDAYEKLQNSEGEFDLSLIRWHKFASVDTLEGHKCTNCGEEFEENQMVKLIKFESGDDSWLCRECAQNAGLTLSREIKDQESEE